MNTGGPECQRAVTCLVVFLRFASLRPIPPPPQLPPPRPSFLPLDHLVPNTCVPLTFAPTGRNQLLIVSFFARFAPSTLLILQMPLLSPIVVAVAVKCLVPIAAQTVPIVLWSGSFFFTPLHIVRGTSIDHHRTLSPPPPPHPCSENDSTRANSCAYLGSLQLMCLFDTCNDVMIAVFGKCASHHPCRTLFLSLSLSFSLPTHSPRVTIFVPLAPNTGFFKIKMNKVCSAQDFVLSFSFAAGRDSKTRISRPNIRRIQEEEEEDAEAEES